MVTVCLKYKDNLVNFAVLLSQIQPQLTTGDDIYIIDSSPTRDALKIATMYGTTRSYIFVEPTQIENSLEFGLQSMAENKQEATIFLNDNCFVSSTFIANMKKAIGSGYEIVSPRVKENLGYKMDNDFQFYHKTTPVLTSQDDFNCNCHMIVNSEDNDKYAQLDNEFVILLKPLPAHSN